MKTQTMLRKLIAMVIAVVAFAAISTIWGASRKRAIDTPGPGSRALQQLNPELGPHLSTEDMASQAEIVAIGRCTATRSR